MKGTKEFYELIDQFERSMKSSDLYVTDFSREKTEMNGVYYRNGNTNSLFVAFMNGYSFAKSLNNINALS